MLQVVDVALLGLAGAWPLLRLLKWHRLRTVAAAYVGFVIAALLTMLVVDASRWPLAPAIALIVVWEVQASAIMVGELPAPTAARWPGAIDGAILVLIAVPAVFLALLVLPRVPPIVGSGPHLVGVRDLILAANGESREIPIRLWFPGEPEADLRPLSPGDGLGPLEAELALALVGQPWGRIMRGVTRTRLQVSSPMRLLTSRRDHPVVVLSRPAETPILLRRLAVDLASHGFVVVEAAQPLKGVVLPSENPGMPEIAGPNEALVHARSLLAGLRAISAPDSDDPLAGRLRADQVGWVEWGTAVDGGSGLAGEGSVVALVRLSGPDLPPPPLDARPELRLERVGAPTAAEGAMIRTAMPGSLPLDFTDLARWSPLLLRLAGRGGFIPAARMEAWIQGWTTTFFGVHLVGLPTDSLVALSSRFPGTTVSLP